MNLIRKIEFYNKLILTHLIATHMENLQIFPRTEKSIRSFSSISYVVPEIQRGIRIEAVDAIYKRENDYYLKYDHYVIPGTISMVMCNGIEYIVDGQHRMQAYYRLSKEHPDRKLMISIDYYYCDNEEAMEAVYKLVNTCTPNDISRMSVNTYKIKHEVVEFFKKQFSSYIKTTSKPITPNINLDQLGEKLDSVDLSIFQLKEFNKLALDLNTYYSTCTSEQFRKWHVDTKKVDTIRQQENQMFLGLYRCYEWVDKIVSLKQMISENATLDPNRVVTFADMEHNNIAHRVPPTKILKKKVWNCDKTEQPCFCCKDTIEIGNFECGHIVSVARGGATILSNLKPVCSPCNNEMGTKNMMDYCKSIDDQLM